MPRHFVFRNPAFPLGVKRIQDQTPLHYHVHEDYLELVVIGGGHATHIIDDMKYSIGPGDVFVIQGGRVHAYDDIRNLDIINILFDPEKLNLQLYDLQSCTGYQFLFRIDPQSLEKDRFDNRFRLNGQQIPVVMALIDSLVNALNDDLPGCQFKAITVFHQLILNLVMNYSHMDAGGIANHVPHLIGALAGSMERDCSQPFNIDEMCRRTNMSRASLFRYFKKYFQSTPQTYLENVRIENASRLLLDSELGVGEIAVRCGFDDHAYFARRFRLATGYCPGDFRKVFKDRS